VANQFIAFPDWVQYKNSKKPSRLSVPLVCVAKTLKVERSATSLRYVPYAIGKRYNNSAVEGFFTQTTG